MEQSPLVQRAVQRLRDGIACRETTLDLDAIKAVLVEMATQKERADRLETELVEVRADLSYQRSLAEWRYTYWRKQLDKTEEMRRCFENEKATSTHLETLLENAELECRKAKAALAVATTYGDRYKLAVTLLTQVEKHLWAYLEDLKEENDRLTFEGVAALHDTVVLFLGHEAPTR